MGYDVHKFVEVVDANLLCGICGLVFEDPVLTPCGHSFCLLCLETWLETAQYRNYHQRCVTSAGTCPECREAVHPNEAKPELSLRNLIKGFYTYCEFKDQGCRTTVKLEQAKDHAHRCLHSTVNCAGCGENVQLVGLPNHQIHCRGIAEAISEDGDDHNKNECNRKCDTANCSHGKPERVTDLSDLLKQMEQQMDILKRDLLLANVSNAIIESEYLLRRSEIKKRHEHLLPTCDADKNITTSAQQMYFKNQSAIKIAEHNLPTGTGTGTGNRAGLNWFKYPGDHKRISVDSIPTIPASRLASFIFQFLFNKPGYIDSRMVFEAIQHCYDCFVSSSAIYDNSVHVLLAIASVSDWFTILQKQNFNQWLQSLARCCELLDTPVLS